MGDFDSTGTGCLQAGRGSVRPGGRRVVAATVVAATVRPAMVGDAGAVAVIAKKHKAKKFNRVLSLAGGMSLSPTTKLGDATYTDDGRTIIKGTVLSGRLTGKLAGSAKRRRGVPRDVKRLLKMRFAGKV